LILNDGRLRHGGWLNFVSEPIGGGGGPTQRLRLVMLNQPFNLVDRLCCLFYYDIIVLLGDLVCVGLATKRSHVWPLRTES
jgi:hypothetical protein